MGAGAFLLRPKLLFVSRGELLLSREGGERLGPTYLDRTHKGTGAVERFHIAEPKGRAALLYVIVVCHVVSFPLHRRVPMHYVPVH